MKRLLFLLSALAVLTLGGCQKDPVNPGPDTPDPVIPEDTFEPVAPFDADADYRLFFIGNSFTKDAVEHLPGILAAAGLKKILMVHMFYGGRTVPEYNDGWETATDFHCYLCNPGETAWTDISGKSLAVVASSARWDVVTIQEHTGKQIAWGWTDTEKAAVQGLVDKVKAAQTEINASPKLYYILSQAYHNLAKAQNVTKPFVDDKTMWPVIAAHARHAVEECGFDGIISTGAMFQNLRTTGYNNEMGLTRDGYHMDFGLARYGASCTVFETVIGPQNGNVTLDNNSYRYDVTSTAEGSYTTPVTDENAPVARLAAHNAVLHPYDVTDMTEYGPKQPGPVEGDNISISTAQELLAFATRVNSGDETAIVANVTVTADIDCSSVTSWTPIGACSMPTWAHNSIATSGKLFCGSFDGQNHRIKNLKMSFAPTAANGAWGFFGGLGKGAVVKNLIFDQSCSMHIATGVAGVFGVLAGLVNDATVQNVKNYAPITGGGTSALANNAAEGRVAVGGVIGWVMASTVDVATTDLYNAGTIGVSETELFSAGGNTSGYGVNGVQVGGIIGFSSNNGNTLTQTHNHAVNDAPIFSASGRVSGIVGAANRYTRMVDCINNGDIYASVSGNARLANISCILGEHGEMNGCVNTGNLIAPNASSVAGVVCALNWEGMKVIGCSSIGATIVGKKVNVSGTQTYNGVLFGQCNQASVEFSGCSVSGKIGTSLDNLATLTEANYFQYAGQNVNNCNATITTETIKYAK